MTLIRDSASRGDGSPDVTGIYEPDTGSIQYIVADPHTRKAALIDVVLNFEPTSAATSTEAIDTVLRCVDDRKLGVEWILDTHPHADHFMASHILKERTGAPNAIGAKVAEIADLWRDYYNMPEAFDVTRNFDRLFADGDTFEIGSLPVRVMLTPGHTLGSVTYLVGKDAAFVNDTFMQPDVGTSRADFPGGSAAELYDSLQRILSLDDSTRLFVGHDYGTDERSAAQWESTVAEQRRANKHIGGGVSKTDYVEVREARDKTLKLPDRMLHALQINLMGGRLPQPETDGHAYLRIPLNRF